MVITCPNALYAREVLGFRLEQSVISSTNMNEYSSHGHAMITLTPVLSKGKNEPNKIAGGSITIMDLAGIKCIINSYVSGKAMEESVAINKSNISLQLQQIVVNRINYYY